MTNSDEEGKSSEDGKVRNDKEIVKQPLRTLPMRQAKINSTVTPDDQTRDSNRPLRSNKPSTSNSSMKTSSTDSTTSTSSITKDKSVKKSSKTSSISTDTSTSPKKVDKKGANASTLPLRSVATGTIQQVIRKPSLRAARRRIKAKNIKARSSKCQIFFCDKCDKVYDHYSELVYHQRRHTGEKPFVCTWPGCNAAFSASNARVRHMRIHTGEKPYVCPYSECGRRFTYWKDLKLHKLRHSGEKPHKCTWPGCTSRFFRRDDLKHHRYTHTGEKPYKCSFPGCESAFTQKSPLNLHMRKIHKILPDSKPSEKSQTQSVHKSNAISNSDGVINDIVPSTCEYPVYQVASNNLIRQPLPNNQLPVSDSKIHQTNNHVTSNMLYVNSNNPNEGVQSMTVTDKLSSILVTCDVSPATVHGVSHTFNQDVNGWSSYAFIQETVDLNQNISNVSRPVVNNQPTNQQPYIKEPNVITRPPDPNGMNHLQNLDDLLADACVASQIPMDHPIDITDNTSANNSLDRVNRVESSELTESDTCAASLVTSVAVPVPSSTAIDSSTTILITASSADNNISKQTNTHSSKEVAGIESSANTESISENSSTIEKEIPVEPETPNKDEDASNVQSPRPARKRANYRINKTPETVRKTIVAIIRQKPVIETKSKKKSTPKADKLGAKRTIAIQTTKRQSAEKTKDGKFKCDYCEREFKAKHDRDCHHMTHTGEKPRACDWPGCDYRCITKSKLTRHRRKHTGERNYACDWPGCDKAFSTSRHQKEHKRTHTGEKPFKCDYPGCDKWFARKDHIKNHRFTHTGEKPRKCPYPGCEAAFIQLSPLKKHMELHKRDNGPVPNRTRKRRTGANQVPNDEFYRSIPPECSSNNNPTVSDISTDVTINPNPIQLDAMTLEMVTSRMVSQHNQPVQGFNMLVQQGQENQNVCLTGYDANNSINHNNQSQVNIDYEVMFRHSTYC